jgi:Mn-dependent DtxR family transcriptional regulator
MAYIIGYAREHNGTPPTVAEIARVFVVSHSTARSHVRELAIDGFLRLENRQIVVEDAEWIPPPVADALDEIAV